MERRRQWSEHKERAERTCLPHTSKRLECVQMLRGNFCLGRAVTLLSRENPKKLSTRAVTCISTLHINHISHTIHVAPTTHTHTHTHDPSLSSPASPPPQFPLPYPQQSCSRSANGCDPTNGCNSASCMADRQFIKDLIANLQSELCIDRRHVHLTGMSAGAIMAYQVAKDLAPEVASIVPVSGLPFFGYNRQPSSPISVW